MRLAFHIALIGIALAGTSGAAFSQSQPMASTPNAMSATQGATTGLGDSHRFKSAVAASAHCTNDKVVWSVGPALTYVLSNAGDYGKGQGFCACKGEADDAGFRPGS